MPLTLAMEDASQMTGFELAERLGLDRTGKKQVLRMVNRHGVEWDFDAWLTVGVGRQKGVWYFHLGRAVKARVVDSDGNDTGVRLDDYKHWRGRANERSDSYQEVR